MAIKLTVLNNGDLEIAVDNREEFEDIFRKEFHDERDYLVEMMESARYTGNDWHCEYYVGLTAAPAIGQGAVYPEKDSDFDGIPIDYENLWYFPEYMILSYLEILDREGKVIFTGHNNNASKKKEAA